MRKFYITLYFSKSDAESLKVSVMGTSTLADKCRRKVAHPKKDCGSNLSQEFRQPQTRQVIPLTPAAMCIRPHVKLSSVWLVMVILVT